VLECPIFRHQALQHFDLLLLPRIRNCVPGVRPVVFQLQEDAPALVALVNVVQVVPLLAEYSTLVVSALCAVSGSVPRSQVTTLVTPTVILSPPLGLRRVGALGPK
jgi:hypothetical protein